jgi:hypothetical protein
LRATNSIVLAITHYIYLHDCYIYCETINDTVQQPYTINDGLIYINNAMIRKLYRIVVLVGDRPKSTLHYYIKARYLGDCSPDRIRPYPRVTNSCPTAELSQGMECETINTTVQQPYTMNDGLRYINNAMIRKLYRIVLLGDRPTSTLHYIYQRACIPFPLLFRYPHYLTGLGYIV